MKLIFLAKQTSNYNTQNQKLTSILYARLPRRLKQISTASKRIDLNIIGLGFITNGSKLSMWQLLIKLAFLKRGLLLKRK